MLPLVSEAVCDLSSVKSYTLVYNEGVLANFLEILLYHQTACEEAGDYLIDMIDWAYRKVVALNLYEKSETKLDPGKEEELNEQVKELEFCMGITSISVLRFITDHLASLTSAVTQQLVDQCDIFCVLVPLMEQKPWVRSTKSGKLVFENQQWTTLRDSMKMPKIEAQIWLIVCNLFMNNDVRAKYELTSYRKNNLLRLRKFLNQVVLDQLPVLSELLRALEQLSIVSENHTSKFSAFLVQQLPELTQLITTGKDWHEIARFQTENYLVETETDRKAAMELMMAGIEEYLEDPLCAHCGEPATNRCSKCKHEWYCARKCQVAAWKNHKHICKLLAEATPASEPVQKLEKRPKITEVGT